MNLKTKNLFFLGKGGVGKSTSSALTSIYLSDAGKKVLLVSMDPAHNQSDIFNIQFTEKPVKVKENLAVKEVDIDYWIDKYLSDVHFQIKRSYSYLTAFNLENYFDIIKYSPGIEEYALLLAYKEIRKKFTDKDLIIFDMPPTALTLKFLGLPKLSLLWLQKLQELRNKIIEKRKIITKVKVGSKEIERDKILNKLEQQIEDYRNVEAVFEDKEKTSLNIVLNPDKLSFSESKLIVDRLDSFNLSADNLIINKYGDGFDVSEIEKNFSYNNLQIFPQSDTPLLGLSSLESYLRTLDSFTIS
ncbi:MAG: ArsA family ATPase [Chlorobi bacterium]|nr:ArsA family ATPase [Chlorobiota bacterium]